MALLFMAYPEKKNTAVSVCSLKLSTVGCCHQITGWVTMWECLVLYSLGSLGGIVLINGASHLFDHCVWDSKSVIHGHGLDF